MSEYNGKRISVACAMRGWTLKELAARADVGYSTLSAMKNGAKPLTSASADKIAAALNVPVTFFMMNDTMYDPSQLTFRAPQRSSQVRKRQVATEYSMLAATVEKLSHIVHMPKPVWIDALAPQSAVTHKDIEHIAQDARITLEVASSGHVPNVIRAFERGGISVAALHTCETDTAMMDGVTQPQLTTPTVGYFTHANRGDRQRFTAAHEAGHIILHKYRFGLTHSAQEDEANRFASAFLMPEQDARQLLSPSMNLIDYVNLKAQWGMSIAAMITRAVRLGIIDRDRQRSLMIQLSARGWRKREPVQVNLEQPILLRQMVGASFGTLIDSTHAQVSASTAEGFLGVPFDMISDWCNHIDRKSDNYNIDDLAAW